MDYIISELIVESDENDGTKVIILPQRNMMPNDTDLQKGEMSNRPYLIDLYDNKLFTLTTYMMTPEQISLTCPILLLF